MRPTYLTLLLALLCACSNDMKEMEALQEKLPTDRQGLEKALAQSKDDTEKLLIYNELFKQYVRNDVHKASGYLEKLKAQSEKLDNKEYLAKYHFNMGLINLSLLKDYSAAIQSYLHAADIYKNIGHEEPLGKSLSNIGYAFMTVGDYDFAIRYFNEARSHYGSNAIRLIRLNINLGICHKSLGAVEEAGKHYDMALELNSRSDFKREHYYNRLYNLKGALSFEMGEYRKAMASYLKSMEYIQTGDEAAKEKELIAQVNIVESLTALQDYGEAAAWMAKARKTMDGGTVRNKELLTDSHNILGSFYLAQGKYKEAEAILLEGVEAVGNEVINNDELKESMQLLGQCQSALIAEGKGDMVASTTRRLCLLQQGQVELQDDFDMKVKRDALRHAVHLHDARNHAQLLGQRMGRLIVLAMVLGLLTLIFFYGFYQHRKKVIGVRRILSEGYKRTD